MVMIVLVMTMPLWGKTEPDEVDGCSYVSY